MVPEHGVDCSNCGRWFDMKCAGVEPPMEERAKNEWLCRVRRIYTWTFILENLSTWGGIRRVRSIIDSAV